MIVSKTSIEPVVITGIGIVSPFGHSVEELARTFSRSHSVAPSASQEAACLADVPSASLPEDKRARIGRLDRLCRFFLPASYSAVRAAGLHIGREVAPERVGLSFGTGLGCLLTDAEYNRKVLEQGLGGASPRLFAYTVSSAAAGEVSIALGITGPNVTAHTGLAAGLGAVGYGFDLIQMGKADVVLAGGADVVGPDLLAALRDMDLLKPHTAARPFRDAVPGLYPSEAAVVFVLERRDGARQRGARCWARLGGYAAGFEPTLTRRRRDHTGIAETLRRALAASGHGSADIDAVLCSAHGTPLDTTEQLALANVFAQQRGAPVVVAPKAAFGDSLGASGVLAAALTAGYWQEKLELPDGVAFDINADPLAPRDAKPRLAAARLVLIDALCYAGPIVALVIAREG